MDCTFVRCDIYIYHADELPGQYQTFWFWYQENIVNPQNSFLVSLFWISVGFVLANPAFVAKIENLRNNFIMGGAILYSLGAKYYIFRFKSLYGATIVCFFL